MSQQLSCCDMCKIDWIIIVHVRATYMITRFRLWAHILLTHWGRVTHICVNKLTIIGSDNGLSPGRHQAIIWTNAGILLIGPWGINFSEILIFSFKKMSLGMSSANWPPFCLGLNVLMKGHYKYMYWVTKIWDPRGELAGYEITKVDCIPI